MTAADTLLHSPLRRFWRTATVTVLAIIVLAINVPLISTMWSPTYGDSGLSLDGSWVQSAGPGPYTAAGAAGLRAGDRIDPTGFSLEQRMRIAANQFKPGETLTVRVARVATARNVELKITPFYFPAALMLKRIMAAIFMAVGTALVLLRPGRMTWGFYLYALAQPWNFNVSFYTFLPPAGYYALVSLPAVFYLSANTVGALMFTARFPRDEATGWRRAVDRSTPYIWVVLAAVAAYTQAAGVFFLAPTQRLTDASIWWASLLYLTCLVALIDTYVHTQGQDRQRVQWVIAGLAVSLTAALAATIAGLSRAAPPFWLVHGYQDLLNVFVPLTVAYAVLRHRLLDINFVISRALVLGTLTTVFVGVFALVDWFFTKAMQQHQLAVYAEVAVALGFGFGLNGMHRRVDSLIDRVLFRRRHLAEARLERVAAGISHVISNDAVDAALVEEPANALQLTSAAIFRRQNEGNFVRAAALGWPSDTGEQLHPNDPLVVHMQGERGPMRLREVDRRDDNFPKDAAAPIIAFPLLVRHQLEGLALYGAHGTGEDIDPDEVRTLERLSTSAAAAYDHLEAESMKREVESVRRECESLRTQLAEAQIQPA